MQNGRNLYILLLRHLTKICNKVQKIFCTQPFGPGRILYHFVLFTNEILLQLPNASLLQNFIWNWTNCPNQKFFCFPDWNGAIEKKKKIRGSWKCQKDINALVPAHLGPRANVINFFYGCNLRMFAISYCDYPWRSFPAKYNVCK